MTNPLKKAEYINEAMQQVAANDYHQRQTKKQGLFGYMPGQGSSNKQPQHNPVYSQKPQCYYKRRAKQEQDVNIAKQSVKGQQVASAIEAVKATRKDNWFSPPVIATVEQGLEAGKSWYNIAKSVVGLPLELLRAQGHVLGDEDLESAINRGDASPTPGLRAYLAKDSEQSGIEAWRATAELGAGIAIGYGLGKLGEFLAPSMLNRFRFFGGTEGIETGHIQA